VFSRSVSDAAYFISILSRRQALRLEGNLETPPRIGFCRTPEWSLADQDTENVLKTAARLATASGAQVRDITLPEPFPKLAHAQGVIADFEVANSAAYELTFHRDLLSRKFVERADAGVELTIEQYDEALSIVAAAQAGLDRLGTALRVPCVNIPGLSGHSGLPVGVQVIGRMMDDRRTLAVGEWLHNILKSE
jgi:Asp-tRNA(Asn)/Glu-tRNA(Gln) amidotransferase A subunit family amidase